MDDQHLIERMPRASDRRVGSTLLLVEGTGPMDTASLIVGAFAAATADAMAGSAAESVRLAYERLKHRLRSVVVDDEVGSRALEQYEADPGRWGPEIARAIGGVDAGEKDELVELAEQLLELIDADATPARPTIDLRGAQGVQIGDHSTQVNRFGPT